MPRSQFVVFVANRQRLVLMACFTTIIGYGGGYGGYGGYGAGFGGYGGGYGGYGGYGSGTIVFPSHVFLRDTGGEDV